MNEHLEAIKSSGYIASFQECALNLLQALFLVLQNLHGTPQNPLGLL